MKSVHALTLFFACAFCLSAEVLFEEDFEDADFSSRGWYDGPSGDLAADGAAAGSNNCYECFFAQGATGCSGGTPGRMLFAESEQVLLSYWVKYSDNYVGSNRPYHPHEFHFITNKDDRWVGPAHTHLTTYTEQVGGTVRIALQDSRNNDPDCILLNNDSFVGCGGDFDTYQFTENRSVCACNGLVGDLDGRDCFNRGDDTYYSARFWDSPTQMFRDETGPYYKNDWHFIECYFQMNTVSGGIGVPDGIIQYWYDGELVIDYQQILFRTGANADMAFNQFLIAPYIGDGSPVDQYMWVDNLTVATERTATAIRGNRGYADRGGVEILTANGIGIAGGGSGPVSIRVVDLSGRALWRSGAKRLEPGSRIALPTFGGAVVYVIVDEGGATAVRELAVAP